MNDDLQKNHNLQGHIQLMLVMFLIIEITQNCYQNQVGQNLHIYMTGVKYIISNVINHSITITIFGEPLCLYK